MRRRTLLTSAAMATLAMPTIAQSSKKITFLTWNLVDQADLIRSWVAEFQKTRPGAEVEWLDKKGPDLPAFYQTQLIAGTPPDVINTQGALGLEYAAQGALLDLTPLLDQHSDVRGRFNADYLANWTLDGKNWMLPFYISKTLLFINKKLYAKSGLSGPPESFDALMEAAERIGGGENSGFITLNFDWLYWPLFKENGVELLTPDLKQTAFDTPNTVKVFERLAKGTAGSAIDKISWTGRWVEPLGAFASGRVGMLNAHAPALFFIKGQGPWVNAQTLGIAEMPGDWSVPNSHGLGISKGSRNPELAWDWVTFVTAKDQARRLADNRKVLSGNTEVDQALLAKLQTEDELAYQVLRTQLEHTGKMCGNWRLGNDSRIKNAFYPELQNAVLGRSSAKSAVAEADRKVSRELRRG